MAEIPTIVRIEEIPDVVNKTLRAIYDGVVEARKHGNMQAQLPAEVAFDMLVVDKYEVLDSTVKETGATVEDGGTTETTRTDGKSKDTTTGKNAETQTGSTTDTESSGSSSNQTGTDTTIQTGQNRHIQNTEDRQDNSTS